LIHPSAAVSTPRYDESNDTLACLHPLVLSGLRSRQKQPAGGSAAVREPERIIRLRTVLSRTGLSRSTIYRKIAEGTFPPQIRISVNGSGWHESDINRWIADPVAWRPKREFDGVR
jgi:prophage regulatory protein